MTPDCMDCRATLSMNIPVIAQMAVIANEVTQSMQPEVMDRHATLSMNSAVIANEVTQSMTPDCMDCHVAARLAVTKALFKVRVRYRA